MAGCSGARRAAQPGTVQSSLYQRSIDYPVYAEVMDLVSQAEAYSRDSLWFEAEAAYDTALVQLAKILKLDSLDTDARSVGMAYRDSILSALIHAEEMTIYTGILVPWTVFWDVRMEAVTDSELTAVDSLVEGIDPKKYSLPLELPLRPRVRQALAVMTGAGRDYVARWLVRKGRFEELILGELRAAGLPEDLIYLSMIESGFNPKAFSRAGASGLWQFIRPTGRRYGLQSNWWLDERRDPLKSTRAAIAYLSALYAEFGHWELAMAGYNCGENRIRRQLALDSSATYWEMALPGETMRYVPKVLAAMIVGHDPGHYGFEVEPQKALVFDTATISRCVSLNMIAELSGTTLEEIAQLNPELKRWCTPPHAPSHQLRLPADSREPFLRAYAELDKEQLVEWHRHVVRTGETLGRLARKYRVSVAAIRSTNNIRGNLIRTGQPLIIPLPGGSARRAAPVAAPRAPNKVVAAAVMPREYTVRAGDNLYDIARRFKVSVSALMQANSLNNRSLIRPGQKLRVGIDVQGDAGEGEGEARFLQYRVRPGDNLSVVARKLGVSVRELINWNELSGSKILAGQSLRYRAEGEASSDAFYYIVKPRDNLWDISRRFGTTVTNLKRLNRNLPDLLAPGMKIRIR